MWEAIAGSQFQRIQPHVFGKSIMASKVCCKGNLFALWLSRKYITGRMGSNQGKREQRRLEQTTLELEFLRKVRECRNF